MWHVELLGGVRATSESCVVSHFESRKAVSLMAYLAYHRDRTHPREALAEMLWPDEDPLVTRDRLRQALAALRRLLEADDVSRVILADRSEVGFYPDAVATDVEQFAQSAAMAERESDPSARICHMRHAIDQYGGELMPGYYESWITHERERLAELNYDCLCRAADLLITANQTAEATEFARRAIAIDRLREEGDAALIRAHAADGRMGDAIRRYRDLERVLRQELGVAPSEATKALTLGLRGPRTGAIGPATSASIPAGTTALEPEGGAVPLNSPFYVVRPTDEEF